MNILEQPVNRRISKKGSKTMKQRRILAAAMTLVLTFVMAAPSSVFADGGTITVTNPSSEISIEDVDFYAYQLFELSYSNDLDDDSKWNQPGANGHYSYTINPDFAGLNYQYNGTAYTGGGTPSIADFLDQIGDFSEEINKFADYVYEYIGLNSNIQEEDMVTGDSNEEAVFNLPYGYYLIYTDFAGAGSSLVAAHILTTSLPNVEVTLKADLPTLGKTVSDSAAGTYADHADQNIGDKVYFKLTSAVPNMNGYTSYTYTVYDTFSTGLTYDSNSVAVKVGASILTLNTDYTVNYNATDREITITFDPDRFINLTFGNAIEITYSATLNENAKVAITDTDANTNEAYLEYSNDPYNSVSTDTTPKVKVNVYTFELDIFKYTLENISKVGLSEASFELRANSSNNLTVKRFLHTWLPVNPNFMVTADNNNAADTTGILMSDEDGNIHVEGLDAGTYYLKEVIAPDGYNLLDDPTKIEIKPVYEDGILKSYGVYVNDSVTAATDYTVEVLNSTGVEFPESGGIGRTIFTIGGLVLMLGAALILIARRKTAQR
jgi:fimbrial isopeptide formation D2 family protein/LPXTG-motif cell wall-anchored protein